MKKMFSCVVVLTLLIGSSAQDANADLVITEFMANPSALSDADGEYFELYNTGPATIDVGDLTISDDGVDSIDLASLAGTLINSGDFIVFGSSAQSYVDVDYGSLGSYFLANGADEIVVSLTAGGELARLNYSNGDPFGAGTAAVLDDISNQAGGVTQESNYIAETIDTLPTGDIGSPGVAGSTIITQVPEPTSALILSLGTMALVIRRRR